MTFLTLKNTKKTLKTLKGKHRVLQSNINQTSIRHLIKILEKWNFVFKLQRGNYFKPEILHLVKQSKMKAK